jgi:hypothetical protein
MDMRSVLPEIAEVLGKETRGEIDGAEVDVPVKGGEVVKGGAVLSASHATQESASMFSLSNPHAIQRQDGR